MATSYGVSASLAGTAPASNSVTETLCNGVTSIFAPTQAISALMATTNAANLGWRNIGKLDTDSKIPKHDPNQ